MKTYKAIVEFYDSQDGNTLYKVGDTYPREGAEVSAERIASLSSCDNLCRIPLISDKNRGLKDDEK